MSGAARCPAPDDLQRFLLGRLSEDEARALEPHLAGCRRCLALAETLRPHDAFLDSLAVAVRSDRLCPMEGTDELIAHVCRLGRQATDAAGTASVGQTPGSRTPLSAAERVPEVYDFLTPPQAPEEIGRFGSYGVLRVLGAGGMGVVFLARQVRPQRRVALKVVLAAPGADRGRRARFLGEIEVVARLQHPNIVQVYEAGEHDGRPYFTMELAEGGSLAARLAQAPLAARPAAELAEALARAMQHAHAQGVVHRDLKPSNILLTGAGVPKVGDFGLAKYGQDNGEGAAGYQTESGALLGTPNYMAPEQATGQIREVGPPADVYALGAILYECLTGRPPFRAASVLETLEQVRSQEPVPLRRLQPGVPRDLQTICLKCLEKDPKRRYARALDLAEDLQRYREGQPIQARPAGAAERLLKWARRKPALAALAGVCVLALAGLVTGAAVYERRLRDSFRATSAEKERADANYRQARDTVQQMLARANARSSAGIPKLQELRRAQQEDALAFFLQIAEQQGDHPEVRFDVARAHHQVGLLHLILGRPEEALQDLRHAEEEFAALVAEFPERGLYRMQLADTLKVLAACHLPSAEGEDCMRRALALTEELVREEPDSVPYRAEEADVRIMLASNSNQHRAAEAEEHYRRAAALYEDLEREQPEASRHRQVLARVYVDLSVLLQQGKRTAQELAPAQEFHDKAAALLEQLRREQPDDGEILASLATLRVNWAYVQMGQGQPEAALADLAKSVQLLEAARRREPNDASFRDLLYRTHGVRGQIYERQKRFAQAVEECKRGVELSPSPEVADFRRLFLALNYARASQYALADQVIEDWNTRATPAIPPEQLLHCATVYCTALKAVGADSQLPSTKREALVERYGSRAVSFLGKLQERGYFRDPSRAGALQTDEDIRLLHGRADFQRLLAAVTGNKQP